jgi:transposase-like protein
MSTRNASQILDELRVQHSHVAVHNWVHKADLQPISTVSADQAVSSGDETDDAMVSCRASLTILT